VSVSHEVLVDRIYQAALFPDDWPAVLHNLAQLVHAAGTSLVTRRSDAWIGWRISPGMAVLGDGYFTSEAAARSRTTAALLEANRAGFVAEHEVMGEEEFLNDPLMVEWGTPAGLHRAAATAILVPGGDLAVFHLQRKIGQPRFGPADLARLDALRPHLARASMLAARWRLERLRAAAQALELLGIPAAILDSAARVLTANTAIEAMDTHFQWLARDRLTLRDEAAAAMLNSACQRGSSSEGSTGKSFAAKGSPQATPIVVHVTPIGGRGRELFGGGLLLLAVSRTDTAAPPDVSVIQGLFDLTAAEARVAAGLLEGASIQDLSRRHRVSTETIRTQVKSLLAKSGVRRQGEFIAKLRAVSITR
jgi:DNA-binding CsgD family transcriptional regulator